MNRPSVTWKVPFVAAVVALACLTGCSEPSTPEAKGHALFAYCSPCHGAAGEGRMDLGAPAIGGMPAWYVEAQLVKFRGSIRGAHPDDLAGMRMRPMSMTMKTDDDIKLVAAHVAGLPKASPAHGLEGGDAARGAAAFGVCIACHQADGGGLEPLKSPPIAGQADWYLFEQLRKFKSGARGAHPDDIYGAQMRAIALTLPDEQAMKDVVAHISSLPRK